MGATTLRRTYVKDGQLIVEEVVSDDQILVKKKNKLNNGPWISLFQNAVMKIVKECDLSKGSLKVLLYLIAATEFDNEVRLTLYAIAKDMKANQGNVVRWFKELEQLHIAIRDKKRKTIRLNYDLAYKGSFKQYKHLQYKDPKLLEMETEKVHQVTIDEIIESKKKESQITPNKN